MAYRLQPIFGFPVLPDATGEVLFAPYALYAANDAWDRLVLVLSDPSTKIFAKGGFGVPSDYVGSSSVVFHWTANSAVTGNFNIEFDYRAVQSGVSMDQATIQQTVSQSLLAPNSLHNLQVTELALTPGNFVADAQVSFRLYRVSSGDSMVGPALGFGAFFKYSNT